MRRTRDYEYIEQEVKVTDYDKYKECKVEIEEYMDSNVSIIEA